MTATISRADGDSPVPDDSELLAMISLAARLAVACRLLWNLSDAESIGNEAAEKALRKFNRAKGEFKPYFLKIFFRAVRSSNERLGAIPRSAANQLAVLGQWHDFLMQFLERKPTLEEIAEASGLPPGRVQDLVETWTPASETRSLDEPHAAGGRQEGGGIRLDPVDPDPDPELGLQHREAVDRVLREASCLPAKLQAVIESDLRGLTDAEIAALLGIKDNTVRKRRHDAHEAIRKRLAARDVPVRALAPARRTISLLRPRTRRGPQVLK